MLAGCPYRYQIKTNGVAVVRDLTEERLRELCDCGPLFGTDALRAVEAARRNVVLPIQS